MESQLMYSSCGANEQVHPARVVRCEIELKMRISLDAQLSFLLKTGASVAKQRSQILVVIKRRTHYCPNYFCTNSSLTKMTLKQR